ncbi:hypothetical protein [Flexivirga caeni]|uniref:hypothetical protein n=1 Tax=Flexivirga caeni TaxID=2294115 RepID=UPI00131560C1|nr:hypothetical protein [Flexivirga caeni]
MRRTPVFVLLFLLLVADVVLVTGALRSTHVNTSKMAVANQTLTAPTPAPTTASGSPTTAAAPAGKVIVAGLNSSHAWRAVSAVTCVPGATRANVARTSNGGQDWKSVSVPLVTVSGLSYAGSAIVANGLDASCQPAAYTLGDSPSATTKSAAWSVDPKDQAKLLADGQPVSDEPCTGRVLDVAVNSANDAVVLCGNGSVQHTTDGGDSWRQLTGKGDTVAIATGSTSTAVYVATPSSCGLSVHLVTAAASGCLDHTKDWTGPLDMAIIGSTMWLVSPTQALTEPVANLS